ncbi:MAG: hypothetical protein JO063_09635 [Pseudonocardiales bacterium]|nr:hypothetical protein [Pseudonocardiales bacterium]MBV9030218.1 hypothetical protein [Pseudonocardiales bacterium]MBW0010359.1 hypothetical protein [Pseudonocardiales bacterium]
MAGSDARVTAPGWVVVGAGLLAYGSSFLPWRTARFSVLGINRSLSWDAWHAGSGAWLSVLLLVVAGVLVLVSASRGPGLTASRSLIMLGLSVLAFVTLVLRWVTFPEADGGLGDVDVGGAFTVSSGAGVGLYLGLVAAVGAVVASLVTFRAAGRNVAG